MSSPERFQAAHGPMREAAAACELTRPGRPVAVDSPADTPARSALDLAPGVVVDHSHAIRLTDTAANLILAVQQAPGHRDRQLLLRDYLADSPNRTVARTPPRLVA